MDAEPEERGAVADVGWIQACSEIGCDPKGVEVLGGEMECSHRG